MFYLVKLTCTILLLLNLDPLYGETDFQSATKDYFYEDVSREDVQILSPENVGSLYRMLEVLDRILTRNNINYWLDGGGLLGLERHGGYIPWDIDLDIEVDEKDYENIKKLDKQFQCYGYKVEEWTWGGLQIRKPGSLVVKIDIFLTRLEGDRYVLAYRGPFLNYPNNYFLKNEIDNMQKVKFGPVFVRVPYNHTRYIKTYYGEDALTYASLAVKGKVSKLRIKDFSPADYVIQP